MITVIIALVAMLFSLSLHFQDVPHHNSLFYALINELFTLSLDVLISAIHVILCGSRTNSLSSVFTDDLLSLS